MHPPGRFYHFRSPLPIPDTLDISRVSGFFFCLDFRSRKKNQSARFCANRVLRFRESFVANRVLRMVEYFWRDSNGKEENHDKKEREHN